MNIDPLFSIIGLSGGELVLILVAMLVCFLVLMAAVVLVIFFVRRRLPPPPPASNPGRRCPRCGGDLSAGAPEGLCPKCLMRTGFESQAAPPGGVSPVPSNQEVTAAFPQFEIIETLGRGGMGVVYKARQRQLDRVVALKILSPSLSRDPAFAERFAREAKALARLNHPNIVTVHESGVAGNFCYFVMEYIDGASLLQMERAKKPLAPEEALAIVPKICDALQYAHDQGVVHRDIKPANILFDKKGSVKIADFGLAKLLGNDGPGSGLTEAKAALGTPHYMAPEQWERPLMVDHRADIFSLGVVFYEMLTGELPLGRFAPPSRKVRVDVRLDEVVLRALEKEPELRYQHASQIKGDVETIARMPNST
jgi:serine/threonine protein kinase